jgi:O-antigen/teichoic acid export membrane protein
LSYQDSEASLAAADSVCPSSSPDAIATATTAKQTLEEEATPYSSVAGWRSWLGQSAWAVTDRALFSMSNFAINVVLARWLSPHDYGAFALAYTVFLLFGAGHTSFLSDPMLVFGAGTYRERWLGYVRVLLRAHWVFSGAAMLVLFIAALPVRLAGETELAAALAALALAIPFILLQWLLRLACYVRMEAHRAAYAGASYMGLVLMGIYILEHSDWLSPATSLGLMGIASLISVAGIYRSLQKQCLDAPEPALFHDVVARHWKYCRWIIGGNTLAWVPQSTCYLLLPTYGGLPAAAALRALINLIMPLLQIYWALASLLVPALVRARGRAASGHIVRVVLGLWVTGALVYWVLLGAFHRPVVNWLYNGQYDNEANLLWIAGIIPILFAAELVLNSVLRSRERPDQIFWASLLSGGAAATVGAALILTWGVRGALMALVCASITSILAMDWQRRTRERDVSARVMSVSDNRERTAE